MVGKAKRLRLHRAVPRPWPTREPLSLLEPGPGPAAGGWSAAAGKDWDFSSSGVFSGLKIDPDTLVKKLDLDSRSVVSSRTEGDLPTVQIVPCCGLPGVYFVGFQRLWHSASQLEVAKHNLAPSSSKTEGRGRRRKMEVSREHAAKKGQKPATSPTAGLEEKTVLSKKEKMKLRKERWLQKIESVKLAKQKQKAEAKRKATPVVGDMQPLMEALPELSKLTAGGTGRKPPKSHVKAKAGPADFSVMKQAQKHRLLEEEVAWFHEVITNPRYRANPLMAISEHLSKRLRQEEEGKPL